MKSQIAILTAIFAVMATLAVEARNVSTKRGKLYVAEEPRAVAVLEADTTDVEAERLYEFAKDALSFSGFRKRASDTREWFVVKNNSKYHITQIKLLMRYTDAAGAIIKEREVTVQCDVKPGKERDVCVRSFDQGKKYYYRYGNKPRLKATPFDVAVRVLRYDVAVERR